MKRARPLIGLLISLGLLGLLFRSTDQGGLLASLREANYAMLVPAVLIYFAGVWVRSVRWGMLLRPIAEVPRARLFRATVIGFTVNDLLPGRLGELARAFLLARWNGVPPAATLGTIVVERLFDGLTLCGLLLVGCLWLPRQSWLTGVAVLAGVAFLAGTLGATLAAFRPAWLQALARFFSRPLPPRPRTRVLELFSTFLGGLVVLRHGRVLVTTTVLSMVAWLSEAAMYYLIMLGFGFDAGPLASLLGMVAANLGTMVPSSPGFIGTFDWLLQTVLVDLFAVEANLATSYTLVVHAALLAPVVVLGLVLLSQEGLSLGDVSRRAGRRAVVNASTDPATRAL